MPKYDYFSITNQTPRLGTQSFLFFVFRKFHTKLRPWASKLAQKILRRPHDFKES